MSTPTYLSDQEEWEKFKGDFKRSFETPEEESRRFQIFQANLKDIREHNEKFNKGETTFTKGINNFADLTKEEFKASHLGLRRKNADD